MSAEPGNVKVAFPLWGIGAAVAAWGLLRGRPLLVLAGAAAIYADRDAEPVRRALASLGLDTDLS